MPENPTQLTYAIQHGRNAGLLSVLAGLGLFLIFFFLYGLTATKEHQREAAWLIFVEGWPNLIIYYSNFALLMMWLGGIAGRRVWTGQATVYRASHTACFLTGWLGTILFLIEESVYRPFMKLFDDIGFFIFVVALLALMTWVVGGMIAIVMSWSLSRRLGHDSWLPGNFPGPKKAR